MPRCDLCRSPSYDGPAGPSWGSQHTGGPRAYFKRLMNSEPLSGPHLTCWQPCLSPSSPRLVLVLTGGGTGQALPKPASRLS